MNNFPEHFLQYVWEHKRFKQLDLKTINGEKITIIELGTKNNHSGADFLFAKLYIDDLLWVGDVEIHIKSSDWENHQHHKDKNYNSVILHVVYYHDKEIQNENGQAIATLILADIIERNLLQNYSYLLAQQKFIPCENIFKQYEAQKFNDYFNKLALWRLQRKAEDILSILKQNNNDFEQTFYTVLLQSFGTSKNAEAMQQLSYILPFKLLLKNKNNRLKLESLLLGQANLLPENSTNEYINLMIQEYLHQKNKYQLNPMPAHSWEFMRMRPANFPTVRIAQLAELIYKNEHLLAAVLIPKDIKEIEKLFILQPHSFWDTRYTLEKETANLPKKLGKSAVQNLIINAIAPYLYAYGKAKNEPIYTQKAIQLWESLPAEQNETIKQWQKLKITPQNAAQTQGLLELKQRFCEPLNCFYCEIGKCFLD